MLGSSMSLCSHFKNDLNVWSNAKLTDCYSDHPTLPRKYFRPLDPSIVTGDDFNNFIIGEYEKGTPVTFDYVLAVPKEETLTLVSIPTLKGYTVLDANTQTDPSNMEISYIGK